MIAATTLRLVLTTPEQTLRDEEIASLVVPMFDGQAGIRPGHAAIVGRLGSGRLTLTPAGGGKPEEYFVDGGFVQVKGQVVSVLTGRALTLDQIDAEAAKTELDEASTMAAVGDEAIDRRQVAQDRARRMLALARR